MSYNGSVKLWRDRSGQGVLEYGLILGLIAMVAIGALMVVGSGSNTTLARAGAAIGGSSSAAPAGSQRAAGFGAAIP